MGTIVKLRRSIDPQIESLGRGLVSEAHSVSVLALVLAGIVMPVKLDE